MNYTETHQKLDQHRQRIAELREEMRALQQAVESEAVAEYTFATTNGPTRLSELFGDKDDLIVIHNMGTTCAYCTLWADGFNGVAPHLENRAAFVVSSPDSPEQQEQFARARGWRFRMVSHRGSSFATDMGYGEPGRWRPGISVFERHDGRVHRVSDQQLGPGDDLCSVWHMFDMFRDGAKGWSPKFRY
jgi:predicted dithiol-disulfide oxidoreductase (DUF899 family)